MAFSQIDLTNRGQQPADSRQKMHISGIPHFTIPRASSVLRAFGGVMMMAMTDGTFAVGRALREGAEVTKSASIFKSREAADVYFDQLQDVK
jgi:hypothetical protein